MLTMAVLFFFVLLDSVFSIISELEDVTSRAEVINASQLSGDKATFGTSVGLADEETDEETTYHIVGPYEADISKGMISTSSPIARAIIGKAVGDLAEVQTPVGVKSYTSPLVLAAFLWEGYLPWWLSAARLRGSLSRQ